MTKRFNRLVALLLCLVMVFQTLPSSALGFEDEEDPSETGYSDVEIPSEGSSDEETSPDDEMTPDEDTAPDEGTDPDEETDPDEDAAPDEGTDPDEDTAPDEETDPDEGTAPDEETDPDEDTAPDEETEPDEDTAPDEETEPDEDTAPDEETDPDEDTDPDEETDPDEDTAPDEETDPDEEENGYAPEGIDFSSRRVLVATYDPFIFADGEDVQSIDGYVYLLSYDTEEDAVRAYNRYSKVADLVEADIPMSTTAFTKLIDINDLDVPLSAPGFAFTATDAGMDAEELTDTDTYTDMDPYTDIYTDTDTDADAGTTTGVERYDIALIDTGAPKDGADAVLSVIDGDGVDINGHGTAMFATIKSIDDDDTLSVLSIQAFNGRGQGYMSDVYKAILLAVEKEVSVISMAFTSNELTESSGEILQRAIDMATDAEIVVVVAAGDADDDVSKYLPTRLDGVYIAGACDENGKRIDTSNQGEEVFCNVVADHTSEAAAILAALIAEYGLDYVRDEAMNAGLVFAPDYEGEEKYDGEYEEHFNLVEVPASDNDPLLALSKLSRETLTLIRDGLNAVKTSADDPQKQESTSGDNVTIEYVQIRWLTPSTGSSTPAYFETLELKPEGENLANQQFQIDFALSGQQSYQPGEIELVFPAHLWKDRYGEYPGYITMSVPENESKTAEFVWSQRDDMIVLTNVKEMAPASKFMIQGTFRGVSAPDMIDGTNSIDNFAVTITVKTPADNLLTLTSNAIDATIDTKVEAIHATKSVYNRKQEAYDVWWGGQPKADARDDLLEALPDELLDVLRRETGNDNLNMDEYAIVRWYIDGTASGSQPFNMYVDDTIWMGDDGKPLYGGIMLGVSGAANTGDQNPAVKDEDKVDRPQENGVFPSEDGESVHALLYSNYTSSVISAYVWTAYPISEFPEDEIFNIPNKQTITVVGWDDGIVTTQEAEADVETRVPKVYTFVKYWDDTDNEKGHRPGMLKLYIYNDQYSRTERWRTLELTKDDATVKIGETTAEGKDASNMWTYQWSDDGTGAIFKVEEYVPNSSGYIQGSEGYGEEGYRYGWAYSLKQPQEFDKETNTWTFTNVYTEGWNGFPLSTIYKYVESYYDTKAIDRDNGKDTNSLNELLKDNSVEVKFYVSSSISAAAQSVMSGVKPNLFALEDSEFYFNDRYEFTEDDVDIASVELSVPVDWYYTKEDESTGLYELYKGEGADSILYAKMKDKDGVEEWVAMAEIDKDGNVTDLGNGATVYKGSTIVELPKGVSGVKLVQISDAAIVDMKYTVSIRVNPTDDVKDMIKRAFREQGELQTMPIYNKAHSYADYDGEGTVGNYKKGDRITEMFWPAWGYLHGMDYKVAANLEKSFDLAYNDTENRSVKFETTLTLTQQSNITSRYEYDISRKLLDIPDTTSGTFYDLLPYGVEPDVTTLKLDDDADYIESYYTISNYRDGRTLLVVKVHFGCEPVYLQDISNAYRDEYDGEIPENSLYHDETYPKEGYGKVHTLTFDSWCPQEIANDKNLGLRYMKNLAAYEANEPGDIGSAEYWRGSPDDPREGDHKRSEEIGEDYLDLMTGLDGDRAEDNTDLSFVYASDDVKDETIDLQAQAGLHKYVTAAGGDGLWTNGLDGTVNVPENGQYSYRLVITSESTEPTSNIVLFDVIEAYKPNEDNGDDFGDRQWEGTLLSVDLTQVEKAGVEPVLYVSTLPHEELNLERYSSINDTTGTDKIDALLKDEVERGVWKEWNESIDMSTVTAIAVDMRKSASGGDFVLENNQSLAVIMKMRAPCDEENRKDPDYFKDRDGNPTDGLDPAKNAHAYNSASWMGTQSSNGAEKNAFVEGNYTKVGIYSSTAVITKQWDDDDDRDGVRPEWVEIELYRDGEKVDSHEFSEEKGWTWTIEHLLRYREDGSLFEYTYKELYPDGKGKEYHLDTKTEVKGDTVEVTLTNTREPEKISIPVTKEWVDDSNNINKTRPSRITVYLYADDNPDPVMTMTITPDARGIWYGVFEDLPKYDQGREIKYRIEEKPVDDYVTEYEEIYNETTDDTGAEDTAPVNPDEFLITNTYHPYGDLIITKTVENGTEAVADKEFTFTLSLLGPDRSPDINQYDYTITDAEGNEVKTGKIGNGGTFTLKGGEQIHIVDIPTDDVFTVTEENTKGFELTGTVYNGDPNLEKKPVNVVSWQETTVEFTNTYTTRGSAQLNATKTLEGTDLRGYQFKFFVYEVEKGENGELRLTDNLLRTGWNDADGNVSFGQIGYSNEDDGETFTYAIVEYLEGKGGYTYDETVYYVDVTPRDNGDGTMTCEVAYYTELDEDNNPIPFQSPILDEEGNPVLDDEGNPTYNVIPAFHNVYEAEGEITIQAWKDLTGRAPEDDEFTFLLYGADEDGNPDFTEPISTTTNTGVDIAFKLKFTQDHIGKTYRYYLREKAGDDAAVIYSNETLCYVVTVIDNRDGTLSFEQSVYDVTCAACGGTGKGNETDCEACGGTGVQALGPDATVEVDCEDCAGTGKVTDEDTGEATEVACETCGGTGVQVQDAATIVPVIHNGLADGKLNLMKYIPSDANKEQIFKFRVRMPGLTDEEFNNIVITRSAAPEREFPGTTSGDSEESAGAQSIAAPVSDTYSAYSAAASLADDDDDGTTDSPSYSLPDAGLLDELIGEAREGGEDSNHSKTETWTMPSEPGAVRWQYGNVYYYVITTGRSVNLPLGGTVPEVVLLMEPVLEGDPNRDTSRPEGMMGSGWDNPPSWQQDANIRSNVTAVIVRDGVSISYGKLGSKDLGANNPKMFNEFTNLVYADLQGLNLNVQGNEKDNAQLQNLFSGCKNLVKVVFGGGAKRLAGRADCSSMFADCKSLKEVIGLEIDMEGYNYTMDLSKMFKGCTSLEKFDVKINFDITTGAKYNLSNMFDGCSALKELDLSSWDSSKISGSDNIFSGCTSLEKVKVSENLGVQFVSLPTPSKDDGYTGKWINVSDVDAEEQYPISNDDLKEAPAGTYVRQKCSFKIKFEGGEAPVAGSMPMVTVKDVTLDYPLPANRFMKYGYSFAGWKDEDGKEFTTTIPAKTYYEGTVILTAQWVKLEPEKPEVKDGEFYIELHGGEMATIENIPAGTQYEIYEETPAGWVLIESSGSIGVIEALGEAEAMFFNEYDPNRASATIQATKTLDGEPADGFTFELIENDKVLQTKSAQNGSIQFDPIFYNENDIGEHIYTIREVKGSNPDINYDTHEETVTVVVEKVTVEEDGEEVEVLKATVTYSGGSASFSNETKPGSLKITKIAKVTETTKDTVFTFRVYLYDSKGVQTEKYDVTLKAGETYERDLPAGTRYEIEEIDVPYGWTIEDSNGLIGTIPAGGTSSASVTNSYSATGSATIEAHKKLIGDDVAEYIGNFEFKLYEVVDGKENLIATAKNGAVDQIDKNGSENNPWYGTSLVQFVLYYDSVGTYTYRIREVNPDNDDNIVYDDHYEEVTVEVTDNGDGTLSAVVTYTYDEKNDVEGALFTNSVKPGSLRITKTLEGVNGNVDTEFTFTVEVKDVAGNPFSGVCDMTRTGTATEPVTEKLEFVDGVATVKLKGGETVTIDGLPGGATYKVTEAESEGFKLADSKGAEGTIVTGETAEAEFVNQYYASTKVEIRATKHFEGGEIKEGMFFFELYDLEDSSGKPIQTVAVEPREKDESWGDVEFILEYDQDDVREDPYRYQIREVNGGLDGIRYDTARKNFNVEVRTGENGEIIAEVDYLSAEKIEFINVAQFDITLSKTVTGIGGDTKKEFDFYVYLYKKGEDLSNIQYMIGTSNRGTLFGKAVGEGEEVILPEGVELEYVYKFGLKHGDTLTIEDLPYGTEYVVWEVLDETINKLYDTTISVTYGEDESSGELGGVIAGEDESSEPDVESGEEKDPRVNEENRSVTGGENGLESNVTIAFVNNNDNVQLPETGGMGTKVFRLTGFALILSAGALWLYSRKRRYGYR